MTSSFLPVFVKSEISKQEVRKRRFNSSPNLAYEELIHIGLGRTLIVMVVATWNAHSFVKIDMGPENSASEPANTHKGLVRIRAELS
jgi:hypothetical protein